MVDIANRLGEFVAELSLAAVPSAVRRAAMRSLLDVVGVALAGSRTELAGRVRDHVSSSYGSGHCRVIGSALSSSPLGAALANGAAAHVLDYDDTCYAGIVHGSAAVFPAVLAVGECEGISGAELLAAFIAGSEVEYALGRVLGQGVYRWWTTALLGTIGAAAGAARALRLDAQATAQAIRIAACQSSGLRAVFGTPAKPYLCGRAALTGIDAALSARAGLAGPEGVFEAGNGFVARFGDGRLDEDAFVLHGRRFALIDPGIAFKLFPVCSAAQAAIEATISLLAEHRVSGDLVERVRCEVTPFVADCLTYSRPRTIAEAQFSMNFAIGCILAHGALDLESLNANRLCDARLEQAMAKVEMVPSAALARAAENKAEHLEAATVTLDLRDGRSLTRHVPAATGTPTNPASDERLAAKFRACAARALESDEAERLLQRLGGLAELASVRTLFGEHSPAAISGR
jgi:2-methylcitrate dehydratase PrpD